MNITRRQETLIIFTFSDNVPKLEFSKGLVINGHTIAGVYAIQELNLRVSKNIICGHFELHFTHAEKFVYRITGTKVCQHAIQNCIKN